MNSYRMIATFLTATVAVFALIACGGSGGVNSSMPGMTSNSVSQPVGTVAVDSDTSVDNDPDDENSILDRLDDMKTIGSAVDPINGDQNPYGLDVAKIDAGKLKRGDLVVCNFNNSANVQGTGTTIVALHPRVGSTPLHITQNASLNGCTEVALGSTDDIWASAFSANDNPIVGPDGTLFTTLAGGPWHGPFGQTFAPHAGPFGVAAFYESNAGDGSIVRINITAGGAFTFDVIATGFPVNHGVPGSILGPSGLQYDCKHDRLFIVDGTNNALYSFRHVSTIPAGSITVSGTTFSGPFRKRAKLIFMGPPLNGPISSALFFNGHLALGNTGDPTGKNLMVEITPHGKVLDVKNVDTGAGAAIFGMVATGEGHDTKLYFNDDNDNTVRVLTP
jgi:hypothetical protein